MKKDKIANAVIRRMPRYYRHIEAMYKKGVKRVSSATLAKRTGLTASQIRQDLAYFGGFGQQGSGILPMWNSERKVKAWLWKMCIFLIVCFRYAV